jgi:hypothetical protein
MQALAAEFSGCRRKIPLLYMQKRFKTARVNGIYFKSRLLNGRAASV